MRITALAAILTVGLLGIGFMAGVAVTDSIETPDPTRDGLVDVILLQKQALAVNNHTIHTYQGLYDSMNTSLEACLTVPLKESYHAPEPKLTPSPIGNCIVDKSGIFRVCPASAR